MNEKSVHVLENSHIEIECMIEASPRPVSYWIKEPLTRYHQSLENPRQNVLQGSDKYTITESMQSHYKTSMRIRISNFSDSDVGVYTCIASNIMGRANSTIRLFGKCHWLVAICLWFSKVEVNGCYQEVETWSSSAISLRINLIVINYEELFRIFLSLTFLPSIKNRNQNSHDEKHHNYYAKTHDNDVAGDEANNER